MDTLSTIEKNIIDYLIEADSIAKLSINQSYRSTTNWQLPGESADLQNRFVKRTNQYEMGMQQNDPNIEMLLKKLFKNDPELEYSGISIEYNLEKKEPEIHLMELAGNTSPIIIGNFITFQRINYLLVKVSNFLKLLETEGYIDKVSLRTNLYERKSGFPYYMNCDSQYEKSLKIKDKDLINNFLECFSYFYVPTYKLIEFKNNNYCSPELVIARMDLLLSNKNIRIAKFGLYISVISALTSLIAIILTIMSVGIPATVRIDEKQIRTIEKLSGKPQVIENHK